MCYVVCAQLQVREKAVDVVVQLSIVLDAATVLDNLLVRAINSLAHLCGSVC